MKPTAITERHYLLVHVELYRSRPVKRDILKIHLLQSAKINARSSFSLRIRSAAASGKRTRRIGAHDSHQRVFVHFPDAMHATHSAEAPPKDNEVSVSLSSRALRLQLLLDQERATAYQPACSHGEEGRTGISKTADALPE
jgi:hypothetical protein